MAVILRILIWYWSLGLAVSIFNTIYGWVIVYRNMPAARPLYYKARFWWLSLKWVICEMLATWPYFLVQNIRYTILTNKDKRIPENHI